MSMNLERMVFTGETAAIDDYSLFSGTREESPEDRIEKWLSNKKIEWGHADDKKHDFFEKNKKLVGEKSLRLQNKNGSQTEKVITDLVIDFGSIDKTQGISRLALRRQRFSDQLNFPGNLELDSIEIESRFVPRRKLTEPEDNKHLKCELGDSLVTNTSGITTNNHSNGLSCSL